MRNENEINAVEKNEKTAELIRLHEEIERVHYSHKQEILGLRTAIFALQATQKKI